MQIEGNRNAERRFQVDEFDEKAIFLCQFCGGEKCEQEDYRKNTKQPNAIEGLHSNWITDDILAMQRPSERLIKEYKIYSKFKEVGIGAIINLQEPGQHPYCGDGIIPEIGFSYLPEGFYANGILCFSECWEDMTATTFEHVMRIMNIFSTTIRQGKKVAVHCHAGRGRTLLIICAWLIYHNRMTAKEVIDLAVLKRQGVLTRSSQRQFLHYFQEQLALRRRSFAPHHKEAPSAFNQFVAWQTECLLRHAKKQINRLPLLHVKLSKQLRRLGAQNHEEVGSALVSAIGVKWGKKSWSQKEEDRLKECKQSANQINWGWVKNLTDPRLVTQLLYDFYDELPSSVVTSLTLDSIKQQIDKKGDKKELSVLLEPQIVHDVGVSSVALILDLAHLLKLFSMSPDDKSQKQEDKLELASAISVRFALLLLSKRRFFPQIFEAGDPRNAQILYASKRVRRRVNSHVLWLAEFLRGVSASLPIQLTEVHSLVFKACQVDSHLYSLRREESTSSILSWGQSRELFKEARVAHSL